MGGARPQPCLADASGIDPSRVVRPNLDDLESHPLQGLSGFVDGGVLDSPDQDAAVLPFVQEGILEFF